MTLVIFEMVRERMGRQSENVLLLQEPMSPWSHVVVSLLSRLTLTMVAGLFGLAVVVATPAVAQQPGADGPSKALEGRWSLELYLGTPSARTEPLAGQINGEIAFSNTAWWNPTDRFGRHNLDLQSFFGRSFLRPSNVTAFGPGDTSMVTEVSGSVRGDSVGIDFIPRIDHGGLSLWGRFWGDSAKGTWHRRGADGEGRFVLRRISRDPISVAAIPDGRRPAAVAVAVAAPPAKPLTKAQLRAQARAETLAKAKAADSARLVARAQAQDKAKGDALAKTAARDSARAVAAAAAQAKKDAQAQALAATNAKRDSAVAAQVAARAAAKATRDSTAAAQAAAQVAARAAAKATRDSTAAAQVAARAAAKAARDSTAAAKLAATRARRDSIAASRVAAAAARSGRPAPNATTLAASTTPAPRATPGTGAGTAGTGAGTATSGTTAGTTAAPNATPTVVASAQGATTQGSTAQGSTAQGSAVQGSTAPPTTSTPPATPPRTASTTAAPTPAPAAPATGAAPPPSTAPGAAPLRVRIYDIATNNYFATKYSLHLPDGHWLYGTLRTGTNPDGWGPAVVRPPGKYEIEVTDFPCGDKIWFLKNTILKPVVIEPGKPTDVTIDIDVPSEPARPSLENKAGAKCTEPPGGKS